ncbi:MAG: deaminase [Candidatus Izemoplasma sp.]
MSRISKDQYFINIVKEVKMRASCCRNQVGCVLVDHLGHIASTGYNGPAAGTPNCTSNSPCHPEALESSNKSFTKCEAIHAEQNALLQCSNVYEIHTCYVTWSPCLTCVKLLLNTTCCRIVFVDEYHSAKDAKDLWIKAKGKENWIHSKEEKI